MFASNLGSCFSFPWISYRSKLQRAAQPPVSNRAIAYTSTSTTPINVYILYTGGTIGSTGSPLRPMTPNEFEAAFNSQAKPILLSVLPPTSTITIDLMEIPIDSTNMKPTEWVTIALRILRNYPLFDSFIVLHGTDTLQWTSAALSFLLPGLSKQICVTGSQHPLFIESSKGDDRFVIDYSSDGLNNIIGALLFSKAMVIPEVTVFFGKLLLRGNRVRKVHVTSPDAFASPNYPPFGVLEKSSTNGYTVRFNQYAHPLPLPPWELSLSNTWNCAQLIFGLQHEQDVMRSFSVIQVKLFPALESVWGLMLSNLDNVVPAVRGVVFEGYGSGNIPEYPSIVNAVFNMTHYKNFIVVVCTQVQYGTVDSSVYQAGAWLNEAGAISGEDLVPSAALAKLTVLLCRYPGKDDTKIVLQLMQQALVGEMLS